MNIECICQAKTLQGPQSPLMVLVQFNAINGQGFYTFYMTPEQANNYVLGNHYSVALTEITGG